MKVADVPGQIVWPGLAEIVTVGTVFVTAEMVRVLLTTNVGEEQGSLLVISQVIKSPLPSNALL